MKPTNYNSLSVFAGCSGTCLGAARNQHLSSRLMSAGGGLHRAAPFAVLLACLLGGIPVSQAQSLWAQSEPKSMFSDKRAVSRGDILTIIVQENTSASKDKNTETSKQSSIDASIDTFFYSPGASKLLTKGGELPALRMNAQNGFSGGGSINNSEQILARAAVQVIDVLPNQNLVIEGRRETAFSGEQQTVVLRGVVRPEDVAANNTLFSYNIADATVEIISRGTLSDAQRKGWFTRIWDKVSPF